MERTESRDSLDRSKGKDQVVAQIVVFIYWHTLPVSSAPSPSFPARLAPKHGTSFHSITLSIHSLARQLSLVGCRTSPRLNKFGSQPKESGHQNELLIAEALNLDSAVSGIRSHGGTKKKLCFSCSFGHNKFSRQTRIIHLLDEFS